MAGGLAETASGPRPGDLPLRGILLAVLCVLILSILTPYSEFVLLGTQIGAFAPPAGALLILFVLCGVVNPVWRALQRGRAGAGLSRRELIGVYIVMLAVAALPSCQFAGWLATVTTGAFYFANPANHWQDYWRYIPEWWGPRAPEHAEAIRLFYEGPREGQPIPWGPWLRPLLAFGPMALALYGAFLACSVLLGKHWIDNERLAFPLVQLPLDLTEAGSAGRAPRMSVGMLWPGLFRSKVTWAGALIPAFFHTLNGLHGYFPRVPEVPLRGINVGQTLVMKPWVAAQPVTVDIYFCLIGFSFLCSQDVPVSIWVFWIVAKLEAVLGCALGWNTGPPQRGLRSVDFPVVVAQQVGGTLALLALMLWAARSHLRGLWVRVRSGRPEGALERVALIALGCCLVGLCCWSVAGGMQAWMAPLLWLLTLAFMLFVHRMMAEGGVNLLWAAQSGPNYLIYALDGGRYLGPRAWAQLVMLPYFIWHFKGAVGPQSFEGLKLAREVGLRPGRLLLSMVGGMVLTAVLSYLATIWLVMRHGGGLALDLYRFEHVGIRPMQELGDVLGTPQGLQWPKLAGFAASAGATWGLSWMRWHHGWWRLHPMGYVLSNVFVSWYLWSSVFVGTVINWLIRRYAGVKGYHASRPFFLGLILGDFLMLGVWTVVNALTGLRGFMLFGA